MLKFFSARYLAGTVAIPGSFPELAWIERIGKEELRITEELPQWTIVRTVSIEHVVAVFSVPKDLDRRRRRSAWLDSNNWVEGAAFKTAAMGIAYVLEHAPVLMEVDFGLIASESVEYCPPISAKLCCPTCEGQQDEDQGGRD